jgi:CoA-transferase family III/Helicase associated domain
MPFPRASQALSRFTVLDLTRVRSGPTCVRQLADWGANVIKIDALLEDAGGEQPGGPRHGSDFQNLHRNKRAMTLNLKDAKGLEVFKRLAERADVVVENFRPDVKKKLGIDYESLRQINPRIVYGSISGFGQDGPYHKRPGFDQIAQGMGGLMSVTGAPGEGPMRVGIPVADLTAGLFCAIGILTALLERDVSGEGQWVQLTDYRVVIVGVDNDRVPTKAKTDKGYRLGQWVKMDVARRQRLEALPGWSWDVLLDQWEEGFSHLKEFSNREGHCRVPKDAKTDTGYRLGQWVRVQRHAKDRIDVVRQQRLEAPSGWSWNIFSDQWEKGFSHLKAFSDREGHCRVTRGYRTDNGYRLDEWVRNRRTAKDTMAVDQKQRLEALPGWVWKMEK